jgi:hypothetical protein
LDRRKGEGFPGTEILYYKYKLAWVYIYSIKSNIRFELIIYSFIILQMDLYYQDILLILFRVPNNPEADILIIEYFILPSYLPNLIEFIRTTALLYRPSSTINLNYKVVINILGYSNISPITIITTITVGSLLYTFIICSYIIIIIRIEKEIILIFRAITSITIIIKLEAVIRIILFIIIYTRYLLILFILICLISFPKRVFTSFAL